MVQVAAWGFLVHLALIGLAWGVGEPLDTLVGTNWLAAIYTPFVAILIFEVWLLCLAIPESTTRALALQFQIVALLVIRNSFKDIAGLDHLGDLLADATAQLKLALDMAGGVALFGLVGVFYRVAAWPSAHQKALSTPSPALDAFILRKKAVAFVLSVTFAVLLLCMIVEWTREAWGVLFGGLSAVHATVSPSTPLFEMLFAVMILADVLLLVLSLQLSDSFQHVFRGAGFVIATILLRVSLSADRPVQVGIAIAAVAFGIVVLALYKTWPPDPWEASTDEHA